MSRITAEMAVRRKQLAQCAEELKKIRELDREEWIKPSKFGVANYVFKKCWKNKTTKQLLNKMSYSLALIGLIDEELEKRKEAKE